MDQEVHRLNRYAEELLADRRPSRDVLPDEHPLHARQAAALLSGIRPGAGIPARRFLTRLEAQIAQWIREGTPRPLSRTSISPRPVSLSGLGGVASRLRNTPGVRRLPPLPRSPGRCGCSPAADRGRRRYRMRDVLFKGSPRL